MKDYEVLCIGDAMIDIFLLVGESEHFHVESLKRELMIEMGAKIPVDTTVMGIGGNACNVSVGLSRLGRRVALMAELGGDDFAEKIVKDLRADKVSQEFLIEQKHSPSTFSVVVSVGEERTIFAHHVTREHDFNFSTVSADWIYLTSLGEEWHEAYKRAMLYVKRFGVKLAFNPGSHQMEEGAKSFRHVLSVCAVLFVNREEAEEIIYGEERGGKEKEGIEVRMEKMRTLLSALQNLGPRIVSITDGKNGAYAIDEKGSVYFQDVMPSKTVEKTGVGDAYATGFLGGILDGKDVTDCMLMGALNSASVIEHVGATGGLLTKEKIEHTVSLL